MKDWSPHTRISVNIYWLITGLFGLAYGIYGCYVFVYLAAVNSKGPELLEPLLVVLAATMFFEVFAEPISGRFADVFGRRLSVIFAFALLAVALLVYAAAGLPAFRSSFVAVQFLAIAAEFIIAIGLAFQTGSLDAWIVEQIYYHEREKTVSTEPVFARANQWFAGGLTMGGVIGSYAVPRLAKTEELIGITWPWLLSTAVAVLAALIAAAAIHGTGSGSVVSASERGTGLPMFLRLTLARVLELPSKSHQLKVAILVTSSIYMIGIAFIYFSTLVAQNILEKVGHPDWLIVMPVLFLIPRLLGPWLAVRLTAGRSPKDDSAYRSLMRTIGMLAAASSITLGAMIYVVSANDFRFGVPSGSLIFGAACVAFFSTSFLVQTSRPITTAYLNFYVINDSERAFLNSMATPFGGIMVLALCLALIVVNSGRTSPEPTDIAWVFVAPGALAMIAIYVACRRVNA